jgi:hypothetical protein
MSTNRRTTQSRNGSKPATNRRGRQAAAETTTALTNAPEPASTENEETATDTASDIAMDTPVAGEQTEVSVSNAPERAANQEAAPVDASEVAPTPEDTEPTEPQPSQPQAGEPDAVADSVNEQTDGGEPATATDAPPADVSAESTRTKTAKPSKPTSARYEAACKAVSETNAAFLAALDRKAAALGTTRHNESVGVYGDSEDVRKLDAEIRRAKQTLEELLNRKRALKSSTPELEEIDRDVSRLRKARNEARAEKKAAAAELRL